MAPRSRLSPAHLVITLLCFLPYFLSIGVHAKRQRVEELTVYVHENRAPGPSATAITVLTTSGNLSEVGFGTIQVFGNTLRDGPENSSTVIGSETGHVITGKQNSFISFVHTLSTPSYNGTLSVQGQIGLLTNELAVIGGTGAFRFADGFIVVEIVEASDLANFVFRHKIYLKYVE